MSSASGRSSPLPSFASPRDVSSVSLFAALTALAHPADSTTVEEKNDALSNRPRARSISGREWWITRRFWDIFTPLVIVGGSPGHHGRNGSHPPATLTVPVNTIPRGGGTSGKSSSLSGNKLGRSLTIPVLKILHPARDQGRSLHRRDGRTNHAYGTVYSTRRVVIAIVGTGLSFLVVFLCFFALFRPLLPSRRSLPFSGDPSTCILSQDEIQRVWLWEIASGRYPSRRKPAVDLRQHAGKKSVFSHNVLGGVQPLGPVIENPGLPKKSELEERTEALAKKEEALKLLVEANAALTRTGSPSLLSIPTVVSSPAAEPDLIPIGPPRSYLSILPKSAYHASSTSIPPSPFAPRPQPYSVLDLDAVMEHCDFSEGRYVRDCLEVLRMNAGMDSGVRRGNPNKTWKLNFLQGHSERLEKSVGSERNRLEVLNAQADMTSLMNSTSFAGYLAARQQLTIDLTISPRTAPTDTSGSTIDSASPVSSSKRRQYTPHPTHPTADPGCDPDYPRIFHIFWAGPFTDKPYSAAMSFLYTQRLGLEKPIGSRAASTTSSSGHLDIDEEEDTAVGQICRPQLWIWINPGPASSRPDPLARLTMMKGLAENPWSKPLLHTRFQESIKFKLWNTTEQLDSVTEMEGWREMRLFNSGGVKYGDVTEKSATSEEPIPTSTATQSPDDIAAAALLDEQPSGRFGDDTAEQALSNDAAGIRSNSTSNVTSTSTGEPMSAPTKAKDELFERIGSTSSKGYDRLSVVLSDMARFVLTHRFGGVYLDADTILLRDWEELWGWHGSFAYRWSRLEVYNTAVLKMQRGSAIGNMLFKTAVANGLDFHPMTISRYTSDANVEGLLLRLPDALFDPAWLNTEYYQRDRPPFPYFKRFEDFFETPKDSSSAPISLGFDGFFKGSFSYHFHNFWWIPFDPARNFPDLGPRFAVGERIARGRLHAAKLASLPPALRPPSHLSPGSPPAPAKALADAKNHQMLVSGTESGILAGEREIQWGDDEDLDFADLDWSEETVEEDDRDLSWAAVLKRTFESFVRGERPNLYGEWIDFDTESPHE